MSVEFSVSSHGEFNFPTIPGDQFPPDDPEAEPGASLPSIYANTDINFEIEFSYLYTEGEGEEATTEIIAATDVQLIGEFPYNGATIEFNGNTATISGKALDIFQDEIFRFVFADGTEENLPQDNTEDWKSIIKWQDPSNKETLVSYTFSVTLEENSFSVSEGPYTVTLTQFVYWFFEPSLNRFKELVAESAIRLKQ